MRDLMVDIETCGTKPGSAVLSIGAVYFDRQGNIGETFYASMGFNALAYGHTDPDTMKWWSQQSEQAQKDAFGGTADPVQVAKDFAKFIWHDAKPWGNGSTFDITILEAWFNAVGVRCPWKFWNVRDVRTAVDLLSINPKEFTRDGTYHNALDDCLHQVKYLTSGTKTL